MKKLLLLGGMLACVCIAYPQANTIQTEDTSNITLQRWRDTCFGLLDLSPTQISSGYLLDYSMAPINDSEFNSNLRAVDTLQNSGLFFGLQSIIAASKVNTNANPISTDSLYINAYRYLRNTGKIPLLFFWQNYQQINPNALSRGQFSITPDSVRLLDVTGRTASPYDNKNIFLFSSLQNTISQFNTVNFDLPAQFWLMPGISSVSVDFGDGTGPRTLTPGSSVSIYYGTEGKKIISATIVTANGTFTAKASIQYSRPPAYLQPDSVWTITVPPVYTGISNYLGTAAPLSLNGPTTPCSDGSIFDRINCDINPGANVLILNGCDKIFDKPIIVVTGFDPLGVMTPNFLYYNFDFRQALSTSFVSLMRAAGFDFVLVTFTKNTDFIENNAKVLEAVINRVNATKTGNNRSTVIGWSMGGLVARYCLKDMEDRLLDHQVGSYFSYDAPHQGANVPLGMQYFFKELRHDMPYLIYLDPQFRKISDGYDSPAAREMLVTRADYGSGLSWTPNLSTLDPVRSKFAQNLLAKGYPQRTTNYGVSFGRGNTTTGTKDAGNGTQFGNFGPGSSLFHGAVTWGLANFSATAYAVPENSTDYICRYRYGGVKVVRLFGLAVFPVGLTLRIRNIKYTGVNPYDDAPGGYENTQTQFVDNLNSSFSVLNLSLEVRGLAGKPTNYGHYGHNFVSVASALDLQNQNYSSINAYQSSSMYFNLDNAIVNPGQIAGNSVNPSTLSPFSYVMTYTSDCGITPCQSLDHDASGNFAYQSNNWNQWHEGRAANQTGQFMARKILNAAPGACASNIDFCGGGFSIQGPTLVCQNQSATYIISSTSGLNGVNVQWSFPSGGLTIQNGQGTPNITAVYRTTGNETVTAVLTNSCGQQLNLTYPIHVGGYSSGDYPVTGPSTASCGSSITYSCPSLSEATNYSWFYPGTWGYVGGQGTNMLTLQPAGTSGYYQIGVRVANACDAGGSPAIQSTNFSGCAFAPFTATPNPSTGNFTISAVSTPANNHLMTNSVRKVYAINVVNQSGVTKKVFRYPTGLSSVNINLNTLTAGQYILHIYDNTKWFDIQVLILR